jgi:hypothetical protein
MDANASPASFSGDLPGCTALPELTGDGRFVSLLHRLPKGRRLSIARPAGLIAAF